MRSKIRKRVVIHRTIGACRRYAMKTGRTHLWQGDDLRWHAVQNAASVPRHARATVTI